MHPSASIRNVAVVAHVDHGKTTLVDRLLLTAGALAALPEDEKLVMDSNALEGERGITIFSKCCAIQYGDIKINLIDTPGHADFGGEVERVLRMADGVLLLVDAYEGPLPQTRFVLRKAREAGLKPIVIINKVDRRDARPGQVLDLVYDLFIDLGADEDELHFPVVYASGRGGVAGPSPDALQPNLAPVLDAIVEHVPAPRADTEGAMGLPICDVIVDRFAGRIAVGRLETGMVKEGDNLLALKRDGAKRSQGGVKLFSYQGMQRVPVDGASTGDIVAISGLENVEIGDTITDPLRPVEPWQMTIEAPTLTMEFRVNDAPTAGTEGDFVTSRHLRARLERAAQEDVALQLGTGGESDSFEVRGRGILHLGILIETLRREGYEFSVGRPRVLLKETDDGLLEPIETVHVEVPPDDAGRVIEMLGRRRGELLDMKTQGDLAFLTFEAPSRGLIGLRSRMLSATRGEAVLSSVFHRYDAWRGDLPRRKTGSQVASETGQVTAYALNALVDRGTFFVDAGEAVYEGQITGEHRREEDVLVNPCRRKALTNMRASGSDDKADYPPPVRKGIEESLEFLADDELLEVTPKSLRLRKRMLKETDRRRQARLERARSS
ncbi:MAG: translational GTPase TypA [Planctomycetes bacterium]|nr:translational GTPase TypA [Planctomycetota bacterium]MCB9828899.1 translational GTPase TypA [Planctomycetota bacterium]MCB9902030.1 translational GTPase TypA [Planctomycetota bacterium]